jgi:ribose transport system ATP-binding protein
VLENAGIAVGPKLAQFMGLLADRTIRAVVEPIIRKLDGRTPSFDQLVGNLSGGNQKKLSRTKWLTAGVRILIVDEPSVGMDVGTKAYLHELLRALANAGTAILLMTSDMPEMITLADEIEVMNAYRIKDSVDNDRNYDHMSAAIMGLIYSQKAV